MFARALFNPVTAQIIAGGMIHFNKYLYMYIWYSISIDNGDTKPRLKTRVPSLRWLTIFFYLSGVCVSMCLSICLSMCLSVCLSLLAETSSARVRLYVSLCLLFVFVCACVGIFTLRCDFHSLLLTRNLVINANANVYVTSLTNSS